MDRAAMNEFWYKPVFFYGISGAFMLNIADVFMGRQVFQSGCAILQFCLHLVKVPYLHVLPACCRWPLCVGRWFAMVARDTGHRFMG